MRLTPPAVSRTPCACSQCSPSLRHPLPFALLVHVLAKPGCDYLTKIPGVGPATALKLVRTHRSAARAVSALRAARRAKACAVGRTRTQSGRVVAVGGEGVGMGMGVGYGRGIVHCGIPQCGAPSACRGGGSIAVIVTRRRCVCADIAVILLCPWGSGPFQTNCQLGLDHSGDRWLCICTLRTEQNTTVTTDDSPPARSLDARVTL